ncbi:hypothetical protein K438DRAFT_1933394 [Mycena galopus ATCC 62051]|nr:hypothetical protein K438DRAFT_1933394 [Mycena galopus ATCC 62051]
MDFCLGATPNFFSRLGAAVAEHILPGHIRIIVDQPAAPRPHNGKYTPLDLQDVYDRVEHSPEDLKFSEFALSLLGLIIAFRSPPSVNQISRVVHLSPEAIRTTLAPILAHLPSPPDLTDPSSEIWLPPEFVHRILQTQPMDLAVSHAQLACWCLNFLDMCDVRDIAYATHHWAYHVCLSDLPPDVQSALRALAFPLAGMSAQQLSEVCYCLKTRMHDRQLIVQFEAVLHKKLAGGVTF